MIKIFKNIAKVIIKFFLNRENKLIKDIIINNFNTDLKLLDIGAAGDINKRWNLIREKIKIFLVEPHPQSSAELKKKGIKVIEKFLYDEDGKNLSFYQTKKKTNSGLLKPNLSYLKKFLDKDRFSIEKIVEVKTSTLDKEIKSISSENINFIKIDTEGAELNILKGSKNTLNSALGLEIECNFFQLRENSPLFEDIKKHLENYNIIFVDFLNIIRWELNNFSYIGQPQFADVLFLKDPKIVLSNFKNKSMDSKEFLNYLTILSIYNRSDIFDYLLNNLEESFILKYNLEKLNKLLKKKNNKLNNIFKISNYFKNTLLRTH